MTVLIIFLISYILCCVGLYLIFPKCNVQATKAFIPGVNFMEVAGIVGRPKWWGLLTLIPIVGIFIYAGLMVNLVRSFGKKSIWDSFLAIIFPIGILAPLAKDPNAKFIEPYYINEKNYKQKLVDARKAGRKLEVERLVRNNPYKKTVSTEWIESITFAVFAAAFIRMFLVEAFVIPTPSMEGSLNVGDYLFVSKTRYGMRTPQTVAMVPLLHNRVPFLNTESYLKKPSLPYFRLPALEKIDHNDPIVFNWPVGDSVYVSPSRPWTVGQVRRQPEILTQDRALAGMVRKQDFVVRPVDKKDHYIKRAVGLPGDSLKIVNKQVYLNGKPAKNPTNIQFLYVVTFSKNVTGKRTLEKWSDWGISSQDVYPQGSNTFIMHLNEAQQNKLKGMDANVQIVPYQHKTDGNKLFPHNTKYYGGWTVDNYGPVWIPKKGATIELTPANIAMYQRTIDVYEQNDVEVKGGKMYINGSPADSYTFKQDYYWAMGDNRHNSEDSRAWGFVPFDHMVGKPLFIWFSTKEGSIAKGINWDRIFTGATKE